MLLRNGKSDVYKMIGILNLQMYDNCFFLSPWSVFPNKHYIVLTSLYFIKNLQLKFTQNAKIQNYEIKKILRTDGTYLTHIL